MTKAFNKNNYYNSKDPSLRIIIQEIQNKIINPNQRFKFNYIINLLKIILDKYYQRNLIDLEAIKQLITRLAQSNMAIENYSALAVILENIINQQIILNSKDWGLENGKVESLKELMLEYSMFEIILQDIIIHVLSKLEKIQTRNELELIITEIEKILLYTMACDKFEYAIDLLNLSIDTNIFIMTNNIRLLSNDSKQYFFSEFEMKEVIELIRELNLKLQESQEDVQAIEKLFINKENLCLAKNRALN